MTNRLAQSQSLYLRKHAENPIDWWPWCEEALEKARIEDKPIFLSIGYSSCHWCTVMEGEAFSNTAIAEYMNTNFIPIKVDREERPDIDSIYMQALQMMVGQGGWPLNIFLSPSDRIPFYGGTYFSLEPRYGRPGFLDVLQTLFRFYHTEKIKLDALKNEILSNLQQSTLLPRNAGKLNSDLSIKGVETATAIIGGKDYGTSFPMIPYAELVLRGTRFDFESQFDRKQIATQRGLDLALGGIFDQVGGGFHRYTVDPNWTVPHFEKMLYDNGQIVEYLANLWSFGVQEPAFERAVSKTVEWLKREMTAPAGYFYAAQDADSFIHPEEAEPEEGAFYAWTYNELEKILNTEELSELNEQFTVTPTGNFEGKNVLQRRHSGKLSESLEKSLAKLFEIRYGASPETLEIFPPACNNEEAKTHNWLGRIPPVTDPKMIVAWNSLMISGLTRAATVLDRLDYLELAAFAANFILDNQWVNRRFQRLNYDGKPAVMAQSEDYALFVKALLDLNQASLGRDLTDRLSAKFWLEKAVEVQGEFDEFLWSIEMGGYYNTASDASEDLLVRERSYTDNATPAANGIAIANLVRLALLSENLEYLDRAEQALQAFSSIIEKTPQACPSLLTALDWFRNSTLIRSQSDRLATLITQYYPTAIYQLASDLPEGVVGLVCKGLTCQEPAQTSERLLQQIQESQKHC